MHFLDIGFSHFTDAGKIFNICKPGSSPVRKQLTLAKEEGRHIDCTEGKKTRSIIFSSCDGKIMLTSSSIQTSTLNERIARLRNEEHTRSMSIIKAINEEVEATEEPTLLN